MSNNTIHTASSPVISQAVTIQSIADSLIHTLSQAGFTIQRYDASTTDKMINLILNERRMKIQQYGRFRYNEFMKSNQESHDSDKHGFWKTAHIIPAYSK